MSSAPLDSTSRCADPGRGRLADRLVPEPYTYNEVDRLDPVEVIKACHAAEAACEASPGWSGSTAKQLLAAIVTAATYRLQGYPDAPWHWTRPSRRSGPPIAVGGDWKPDLPGVTWVSLVDEVCLGLDVGGGGRSEPGVRMVGGPVLE